MLVTLGTNNALSAGASITFPYACSSVQKVFVKVDDSTGSTAYDHYITVQLGSRTICNGIWGWGLLGASMLQGGNHSYDNVCAYQIDFGSHQLLDNENLYVTVRGGAAAIDAVDVSAVVDEPQGEFPVRWTDYSDNTFTAENVLLAMNYSSNGATVDEDSRNIEIRSAVNSSSPSLISCNNWYQATNVNASSTRAEDYGLLVKCGIPLTHTFNYPGSGGAPQNTDRILVASQMGTSRRAVRQGVSQKRIAQSQVGK